MTMEMKTATAVDTPALRGVGAPSAVARIPRYLERSYWWAYVHPQAVRLFEREWLVNLILFGNYRRLCDRVLAALGPSLDGHSVQIACVYGQLTPKLAQRLAPQGHLDVVDVLPVQLKNLRHKLADDDRITLIQSDATALPHADASCDRALLFFLLHEQPQAVRRATLAEALRVVKPGGRIVIVDYHRPHTLHPLRLLMRGIFRLLEPYAMDLWRHELEHYLPPQAKPAALHHSTLFGGLYQILVLTR